MSIFEEIYTVQKALITFTSEERNESELFREVKKLKVQHQDVNIDLALQNLIEKGIISYHYPDVSSECKYSSALACSPLVSVASH